MYIDADGKAHECCGRTHAAALVVIEADYVMPDVAETWAPQKASPCATAGETATKTYAEVTIPGVPVKVPAKAMAAEK